MILIDRYKLKPFYDLTYNEKVLVLKWRNSDNIRKWMHNTEIINDNDHFNFIEKLKDSIRSKYFLILEKNNILGVIYFTNIFDNSCGFGLYTNPELKGMGTKLMDIIKRYAFSELGITKLEAEVYSNNEKAVNLYLKESFVVSSSIKVGNRELLRMELVNENRKV